MQWEDFLTILVFVFAFVMAIAGVFTAYFGSGKSRRVGLALLIIGIVLVVLWALLVTGGLGISLFADVAAWDLMYETIITVVAVAIGALAAVGIFLVAVMKS
jgi:uncharacterized membrane protein